MHENAPVASRHAYEPSPFWHRLGKAGFWRIFGNTLPLTVNLRYLNYGRTCRRVAGRLRNGLDWPFRRQEPVMVRGAIDPQKAGAIVARVSAALEKGELRRTEQIPFMVSVPRPLEFFGPAVLDMFDGKLGKTLEELLGSKFRIEWLDYYRTFPGAPVKSWLWHIDNDPPFVVKVLLYMTDSTVENGATRVFYPDETRRLFSSGYFGVSGEERISEIPEESSKSQVVTAHAGDALIFSTNLLHKGGEVRSGFRDVMSFLILPSEVSWREDLERRGLPYVHNASGFPLNPRL